MMMTLSSISILFACCCCQPHDEVAAGPQSPAPRIHAKAWYQNPRYELADDRAVVLFFFERDDAESRRYVKTLNRLARRDDIVVIGLTDASPERTERFIKDSKVRFTVGAGSDAHRDFGVKRRPAVFRYDRTERLIEPALLDSLPSLGGVAAADVLATLASAEDLEDFVGSSYDPEVRADAVKRLFEVAPPQEFSSAAERLLAEDPESPLVHWRLEFFRRKASGEAVDDQIDAPSMRALRERSGAPEAERWQDVAQFEATVASRDLPALIAGYKPTSESTPVELLKRFLTIREMLVRADGKTATGEVNEKVRAGFLSFLESEPDSGLRALLALGIKKVATVGDVETAARLDEIAASDPNIYIVRPYLEYAAEYIRTGVLTP